MADDTYWGMIVRGGKGVATSYSNGVLTVQFGKALVAAGNSNNYGKLPIGSAAWVDRPLNAAEPSVLKYKIDEDGAQTIIDRLKNGDGYWKFNCKNAGNYFDVRGSAYVSRSVGID